MGASQSSTYQPSITSLSKKDGNLVFKKIDDTEERIPIDTVSIQNVVVDSDGNLVITRTNGSKDGPFNIKGPKGDSIIGPKGDSIIGPKGDSIVGPPGRDSTVPGPKGDSIIGPKGDSIVGPPGRDSTVPGPPGKDSDLNYAKFETTMKSKSVWCDNGDCVTPGNSTVNGSLYVRGPGPYTIATIASDVANLRMFANSSTKGDDGAVNSATVRNDNGELNLGNSRFTTKFPGKVTVVNDNPNITLQTSSLGGGTINFGNPSHGVKREGNDVVMFTAGEASLKLRNDGVDTLVSKANELNVKGKITANGIDILAELDDLKKNTVRKDKQYNIKSKTNDWLLGAFKNEGGGSASDGLFQWSMIEK